MKLNELMKSQVKADPHTDRYTDRFGTNDLQRVTLDCEQSTDCEPIRDFMHWFNWPFGIKIKHENKCPCSSAGRAIDL